MYESKKPINEDVTLPVTQPTSILNSFNTDVNCSPFGNGPLIINEPEVYRAEDVTLFVDGKPILNESEPPSSKSHLYTNCRCQIKIVKDDPVIKPFDENYDFAEKMKEINERISKDMMLSLEKMKGISKGYRLEEIQGEVGQHVVKIDTDQMVALENSKEYLMERVELGLDRPTISEQLSSIDREERIGSIKSKLKQLAREEGKPEAKRLMVNYGLVYLSSIKNLDSSRLNRLNAYLINELNK